MSYVIKQFDVGPMLNFCYMIGDKSTQQAWIVDPAWAPEKISGLVENEGFKLAGLVISHAHYDHTNAIEDILETYDIPVYANEHEIPYAKSGASIVGSLGRTVKAVKGDEVINIGETPIRFLHTPGHTPGSQCLIVGNSLITGDTLFIGGCGRADLPGGNAELLQQSLNRISKLPSHLMILPGHNYGDEKKRELSKEVETNPYLHASLTHPSTDRT